MLQHFCITEQGQRCCEPIGHIWLSICVYNKLLMTEGKLKCHNDLLYEFKNLWSYDDPFMRYNHLTFLRPWFDLIMSSNVKNDKVN